MPVHPNHLTLRLLLFAAAGVLLVTLGSSHQAQMQSPERPASLVVSVRMPDGSPLDTPAVVNLNTFSGTPAGIGVFRSGTAEFTNLSPASYTLEIIAAGYRRATQNQRGLERGGGQETFIPFASATPPSAASPPPRPPLLPLPPAQEKTKNPERLRPHKTTH